jgi:hypothetical protein
MNEDHAMKIHLAVGREERHLPLDRSKAPSAGMEVGHAGSPSQRLAGDEVIELGTDIAGPLGPIAPNSSVDFSAKDSSLEARSKPSGGSSSGDKKNDPLTSLDEIICESKSTVQIELLGDGCDGSKPQTHAPQWKDSVLRSWLGLQERFPKRLDFTFDEICDYTEENWDEIRGSCEKRNEWKASVRRVCTSTGVLAKSLRLDAAPNSWILGDSRKAVTGSKSGHKGIKASKKRDFEDMAGSNGEDDSRHPHSHQPQGLAGLSSHDDANGECTGATPGLDGVKRKGVSIPPTEEAIARAAISSEWTEIPPGPVRLSERDRSPALTFVDGPEHRLTVRGFKGYRMVRATHGVTEGDWYFEATVLPHEADGAVRLGWSTRRSDTETPVGFDGQSFGIRDRTGEFVHKAQLRQYGSPFGVHDVIGCRISLPNSGDDVKSAIAESDRRWLEYRFVQYLQGKAPPDTGLVHDGAFVEFFKNGVSLGVPDQMRHGMANGSFSRSSGGGSSGGVAVGLYFPSVALYRNATVKVNFGPDFKFPCPSGCKPYSECATVPKVDQDWAKSARESAGEHATDEYLSPKTRQGPEINKDTEDDEAAAEMLSEVCNGMDRREPLGLAAQMATDERLDQNSQVCFMGTSAVDRPGKHRDAHLSEDET